MPQSLAPTDERFAIDRDALDTLFREARTANTFSDEPVTNEQLEAIYEILKWAPTSANTQPLRIHIVRSPEAKARLLPLMSEGNRAKTESAPAVAILSADLEFHENLPRLFPHNPNMKDYFGDPVARETFSRFNAAIQAGYFTLAVRAVGLAAGPRAGFDGPGVDAEFLAGTPLKSILVVNIGKPGENPWFDRSPRMEFNEVVTVL